MTDHPLTPSTYWTGTQHATHYVCAYCADCYYSPQELHHHLRTSHSPRQRPADSLMNAREQASDDLARLVAHAALADGRTLDDITIGDYENYAAQAWQQLPRHQRRTLERAGIHPARQRATDQLT